MYLDILIKKIINRIWTRPYLKLFLNKSGKNLRIGYSSELRPVSKFSIGDNFYAGPYSYFITNNAIDVKIGDYVMFGPFCKILGGNHDIQFSKGHLMQEDPLHYMSKKSELVIENGAWIGANCTILTNTFLSEGVVVGANSLINKYLPPYSICFGNPVKVIKRRFDDTSSLKEVLKHTNSKYDFKEILNIYAKYNI